MFEALSPEKLKRYKDIAALIVKYGNNNLTAESNDFIPEEMLQNKEEKKKAEELANDLEEMGPTFIKLGQLLSTRPDFLPPVYLESLSRLQDKVEPFSFEEVEAIVEVELGVRLSKGFKEFDSTPLAAASLGQVHYAVTRDGKEVAVKIQRPKIRERISEDIKALEEIAASLEKHTSVGRKYAFKNVLHEFRNTLVQELDYLQEANNLIRIGKNLKGYKNIIIPQPIKDYTTSRVLTMEYIEGVKITKLSPLARLEINGSALATDLFKAYLDQVLVDGFFHADPHPGNVFITENHNLALIDLGMVAHIEPSFREKLLKLLLHVSEGKGIEVAKIGIEMSSRFEDFNEESFTGQVKEFVTKYHNATLEQIKVGRVVIELAKIAGDNGLRMPSELTMLGKTLLNLDEIGKTLEPKFNPNAVIREHAQSILQKHMMKDFSPGNIFSSILDANEFIQKLPGRLNNLFDSITDNKIKIGVEAFDDIELMHNLQKIANRITMGLVLAALIIGAALMMQVKTQFTIFGYSGLAIILFLIAAVCGFFLVFSIWMGDRFKKPPRKK